MDRILQSRPATLTALFEDQDGTTVDPGVVTVTVARADGTTVTTGTATGTGAAGRSFALTSTHTALLDTLSVSWVSTTAGTVVAEVQVAGGFLFTITEARTALGDVAYDAAKIREARTYAETELESALGYALVPRYRLETFSGCYRAGLLPPFASKIRSVTVDGYAWSADQIAAITPSDGSLFYAWPGGHCTVVVGYEHGLTSLLPGATRTALSVAMDFLGANTSTGIDPRATSIITVDGTVSLRSAVGQFSAVGVNEWVGANRIPAVG
jgi:hypothetical protein